MTESFPRLIFEVMSEERKTEPGRPRSRGGVIVSVCLVAAAVVVAALVVAKNARRVSTGPVPVALQAVPTDTGLTAFRVGLWRKTKALERRSEGKMKLLDGELSPAADSLLKLSRAGIAGLLAGLARLDSVPESGRKAAQDSLKAEYERVKADVNAFTRLRMAGSVPNEDSLDEEVRKLIGE